MCHPTCLSQEEDRIIVKELGTLKKLNATRLNKKQMKEFVIRLMYVEMLGYDAEFGYMKAVELASTGNMLEKRVGYLCAGLCLSPEHELRMMFINRLQKDMQSDNVLEIC